MACDDEPAGCLGRCPSGGRGRTAAALPCCAPHCVGLKVVSTFLASPAPLSAFPLQEQPNLGLSGKLAAETNKVGVGPWGNGRVEE